MAQTLRVVVSIGSYNQRRYGRPWIAKVTAWPVGDKPALAWGGYAGDDNGGELEIMAAPGDIIRWGQKDGRGNSGSNEWGIVSADGKLVSCDQPEARKQWATLQTPTTQPAAEIAKPINLSDVSDDQLLAEIRKRGLTVAREEII